MSSLKKVGMTPTTRPPSCRAAPLVAPISPQIAATVEQRVAAAGDGAAELPRGLCDLFAVRERRPAED